MPKYFQNEDPANSNRCGFCGFRLRKALDRNSFQCEALLQLKLLLTLLSEDTQVGTDNCSQFLFVRGVCVMQATRLFRVCVCVCVFMCLWSETIAVVRLPLEKMKHEICRYPLLERTSGRHFRRFAKLNMPRARAHTHSCTFSYRCCSFARSPAGA